jgi:hypothetical protein
MKDNLTNERLSQRFKNPFDLVNYAIGLAKIRVERGEGLDSNPANDVIELITKGEDTIDEDETEEGEGDTEELNVV